MKSGKNINFGLFLLRLVVGGVFLYHGVDKLTNMEGTIQFFSSLGFGAWVAWLVALVETLGGVAMILGVCTATAAALFVVVMLVAIIKVKIPGGKGYFSYELDLAMLVSSVAIWFTGAGSYALPWCKKADSTTGTSTPTPNA